MRQPFFVIPINGYKKTSQKSFLGTLNFYEYPFKAVQARQIVSLEEEHQRKIPFLEESRRQGLR